MRKRTPAAAEIQSRVEADLDPWLAMSSKMKASPPIQYRNPPEKPSMMYCPLMRYLRMAAGFCAPVTGSYSTPTLGGMLIMSYTTPEVTMK
eukprot:CAMPEP_0196770450 /NCGR_PEP_ID=MMETSP1104-20130614/1142_1 /TAXON_ID=33652 /ORGANISM="Cafeteria sp., Strain Caron Lab Isolate" /LENGTH=90 /DNA_ID=CAMNT_0042140563 /DNA_START=86 /DNA_END=358 /DNA_ORIENTATION=+